MNEVVGYLVEGPDGSAGIFSTAVMAFNIANEKDSVFEIIKGRLVNKPTVILDRDAAWKITGVPLKTVISYLQSLPPDARIMQQDNDHLELIVVK